MPKITNIEEHINVVKGHDPTAFTSETVTGTAFSRIGFDSCALKVTAGVATGGPSAQTLDSKLQTSDLVGSGFADIANGAITQITADGGEQELGVDLRDTKEFIRVVSTVVLTGGSTPTWPASAEVVLGTSDVLPA